MSSISTVYIIGVILLTILKDNLVLSEKISELSDKSDHVADNCDAFLYCEDEMMSIHKRCTERSRNATAMACNLTEDFNHLSKLMNNRIQEFQECVTAKAAMMSSDPIFDGADLDVDEEDMTSCKNNNIEDIARPLAKKNVGCWRAVAIIRTTCQRLRKCCPPANMCMKSLRDSIPTVAVREKHVEINRKTLECRNKIRDNLTRRRNTTTNQHLATQIHSVLAAQSNVSKVESIENPNKSSTTADAEVLPLRKANVEITATTQINQEGKDNNVTNSTTKSTHFEIPTATVVSTTTKIPRPAANTKFLLSQNKSSHFDSEFNKSSKSPASMTTASEMMTKENMQEQKTIEPSNSHLPMNLRPTTAKLASTSTEIINNKSMMTPATVETVKQLEKQNSERRHIKKLNRQQLAAVPQFNAEQHLNVKSLENSISLQSSNSNKGIAGSKSAKIASISPPGERVISYHFLPAKLRLNYEEINDPKYGTVWKSQATINTTTLLRSTKRRQKLHRNALRNNNQGLVKLERSSLQNSLPHLQPTSRRTLQTTKRLPTTNKETSSQIETFTNSEISTTNNVPFIKRVLQQPNSGRNLVPLPDSNLETKANPDPKAIILTKQFKHTDTNRLQQNLKPFREASHPRMMAENRFTTPSTQGPFRRPASLSQSQSSNVIIQPNNNGRGQGPLQKSKELKSNKQAPVNFNRFQMRHPLETLPKTRLSSSEVNDSHNSMGRFEKHKYFSRVQHQAQTLPRTLNVTRLRVFEARPNLLQYKNQRNNVSRTFRRKLLSGNLHHLGREIVRTTTTHAPLMTKSALKTIVPSTKEFKARVYSSKLERSGKTISLNGLSGDNSLSEFLENFSEQAANKNAPKRKIIVDRTTDQSEFDLIENDFLQAGKLSTAKKLVDDPQPFTLSSIVGQRTVAAVREWSDNVTVPSFNALKPNFKPIAQLKITETTTASWNSLINSPLPEFTLTETSQSPSALVDSDFFDKNFQLSNEIRRKPENHEVENTDLPNGKPETLEIDGISLDKEVQIHNVPFTKPIRVPLKRIEITLPPKSTMAEDNSQLEEPPALLILPNRNSAEKAINSDGQSPLVSEISRKSPASAEDVEAVVDPFNGITSDSATLNNNNINALNAVLARKQLRRIMVSLSDENSKRVIGYRNKVLLARRRLNNSGSRRVTPLPKAGLEQMDVNVAEKPLLVPLISDNDITLQRTTLSFPLNENFVFVPNSEIRRAPPKFSTVAPPILDAFQLSSTSNNSGDSKISSERLEAERALVVNLEKFLRSKKEELRLKTEGDTENERLLTLRRTRKEYEMKGRITGYCELYSTCIDQMRYAQKKCHEVEGARASQLIPGLPQRRYGTCNAKLLLHYQKVDSVRLELEESVENCLVEEIVLGRPKTLESCPTDWPVLPYFEPQLACPQKISFIQNHCKKLARCCTSLDTCQRSVQSSALARRLHIEEERLRRRAAECQVKAHDEYHQLRQQLKEEQERLLRRNLFPIFSDPLLETTTTTTVTVQSFTAPLNTLIAEGKISEHLETEPFQLQNQQREDTWLAPNDKERHT